MTGGWAAGLLLLAQATFGRRGETSPRRWHANGSTPSSPNACWRHCRPPSDSRWAAAALLPEVDVARAPRHGVRRVDGAGETLEGLRRLHTFFFRLDRQPPSIGGCTICLRSALAERFERAPGNAAWRDRVQRAAAPHQQPEARAAWCATRSSCSCGSGDTAAALDSCRERARALVKAVRLRELDDVAALLGCAGAEQRVVAVRPRRERMAAQRRACRGRRASRTRSRCSTAVERCRRHCTADRGHRSGRDHGRLAGLGPTPGAWAARLRRRLRRAPADPPTPTTACASTAPACRGPTI